MGTNDIKNFVPSCSRGDRTRFFLKVQDGCDYYCTYCTVAYARGHSRNPSIGSLVEQARQAAAEGGREIVITGVNIGDFGKSTGDSFIDLIRELDRVEEIARYRISSIEPNLLTDEVIDFVAQSRAFMPHFHIPLQSGSNEVLKLMHRRYERELFAGKVARIKSVMPDAFIGVDVIVGMRGETDELFEDAYVRVQLRSGFRTRCRLRSSMSAARSCWNCRTARPARSMRRISAVKQLFWLSVRAVECLHTVLQTII